MASLLYSTKSTVRRGRSTADLKMPFTEHGVHVTRMSTTIRRRLRRQRLLAAVLVGGGIIATIIDVAVHAWIALHNIALKGNATAAAVVAVGISPSSIFLMPDSIFLIITFAGLLLSIATAIEARWRRLRPAR
jgi:hypothetical protein